MGAVIWDYFEITKDTNSRIPLLETLAWWVWGEAWEVGPTLPAESCNWTR